MNTRNRLPNIKFRRVKLCTFGHQNAMKDDICQVCGTRQFVGTQVITTEGDRFGKHVR